MNIDFLILDFIKEYIKNPAFDFLMPAITSLGNGGLIWIISAVVLIAIPKYRKGGIALASGLIIGLLLGNLTLKPLIARTRPFDLVESIELLITAPRDFSFPSGHTLSSFVGAFILTMTDKRFGYVAIPLAVLIAFSRLYLYVHFPSDILGGIVLAAIISIVIYFIFFKKKSLQ
ncbi:MAG: phosphatase PAP2 family protein [Clostridia bacterium]|nr:phosphatase PAP2 family protein [Clostridia bacterium]